MGIHLPQVAPQCDSLFLALHCDPSSLLPQMPIIHFAPKQHLWETFVSPIPAFSQCPCLFLTVSWQSHPNSRMLQMVYFHQSSRFVTWLLYADRNIACCVQLVEKQRHSEIHEPSLKTSLHNNQEFLLKSKGDLNREILDTEVRVMFWRCFWPEIFPDPSIQWHRNCNTSLVLEKQISGCPSNQISAWCQEKDALCLFPSRKEKPN